MKGAYLGAKNDQHMRGGMSLRYFLLIYYTKDLTLILDVFCACEERWFSLLRL